MTEAEVVCDSVSPERKRLTTFRLRYPKFIHGEFMTHRVFSRNASSSRAIPVAKMIAEVRSDAERAAPVFWGSNKPGMQSGDELTDDDLRDAKGTWALAAQQAADRAESMACAGAHKQIANRILEPFLHINVVATATELDNFFGLRLHHDAQPEMRALAVAMWEARRASEPRLLRPGQWHLPFVDRDETTGRQITWDEELDDVGVAIRVSVARCARVSYASFETGKRSTVEEDLKLYERLLGGLGDPTRPLHASPAEHQATPDEHVPDTCDQDWKYPDEHGNLVGWRQFRKTLPGEAVAPLPEEYRR